MKHNLYFGPEDETEHPLTDEIEGLNEEFDFETTNGKGDDE